MSTKNRHTSAFPRPNVYDPKTGTMMQRGFDGMTLRDYFAAAALPCVMKSAYETAEEHDGEDAWNAAAVTFAIAATAYDIADAMMAEREEQR